MKDRTRRQLAQALIEEIGASNPESLDTTVFRAVLEIRRLRKRAEEAEASGDAKLLELRERIGGTLGTVDITNMIDRLLAEPAPDAEPSPFSRLTPRAAPPPDTTMRGEDIDDVDYNDPLQNYRRWFRVYGATTLEKAIDELCRREEK